MLQKKNPNQYKRLEKSIVYFRKILGKIKTVLSGKCTVKGPFLSERSELKVSRAGPGDINIQVGRSLKLRLRRAYILISRTILTSWGCLNKVPQTGWLINHRNLLKLWRLGVGDQGAGRVLFWRQCFSRLQTASLSYPHREESRGEKQALRRLS